jgi:hypothetical protein
MKFEVIETQIKATDVVFMSVAIDRGSRSGPLR